MELSLACCCSPRCSQLYLPFNGNDGVARGIRFNNCTVRIDSGPWGEEDVEIETIGEPTGVTVNFNDVPRGSDPMNHFGFDPLRDGGAFPFVYGQTTQHPHTFDDAYIGNVYDLSNSMPHLAMSWGDPEDETAVPYCSKSVAGPQFEFLKSTEYESDFEYPTELEIQEIRQTPIWFHYNKRRYISCKQVNTVGFYTDPEDMPKTYAELNPGDTVTDAQIVVYYRDSVGYLPTAITTPVPSDYEQMTAGVVSASNGDGPFLQRLTVDEIYRFYGQGIFSEGRCSFLKDWYANYDFNAPEWKEFFSENADWQYTGGPVLPTNTPTGALNVNNATNGFPHTLASANNGGFYSWGISFEAEWNAGILDIFQVTDEEDTLFAAMVYNFTPQPDGTVEDVIPSVRDTTFTNVGLSARQTVHPAYEGTASFDIGSNVVSGTHPHSGKTKQNTTSKIRLYLSEEVERPVWRNPDDFTEPMASTGPETDQGVTAEGPATDASFTREEIP